MYEGPEASLVEVGWLVGSECCSRRLLRDDRSLCRLSTIDDDVVECPHRFLIVSILFTPHNIILFSRKDDSAKKKNFFWGGVWR